MALEATKIYGYTDTDLVRVFVRGDEASDRGDWLNFGTYILGDVVTYAGAFYYCRAGNTGMVPTGEIDDYWAPLAEIDDDELASTDPLTVATNAQNIAESAYDLAVAGTNAAAVAQAGVDALNQNGRSLVVVLGSRFTPAGTGPDSVEALVPYEWNGTLAADWTVTRASVRVATAGGAPSVQFEKSTGTGAFDPTTLTTVTLGSGAYEAAVTSIAGTVASGDKLRMNILNAGSAQNWYVSVQLHHPF